MVSEQGLVLDAGHPTLHAAKILLPQMARMGADFEPGSTCCNSDDGRRVSQGRLPSR